MYYSDFRLNIPVKQTVWWWKSKYFNFHEKQPVRFRRGERSESSLPSPTCLSRGYWTAVRLGIFFPLVMFPFRPRPQRSGIIHDDFQNGVVLAGVFSEERGGRCGERLGCLDLIWSWLREAQDGAPGKTWRECTLTASSTLVLYLYLLLCSH